MRNSKHQRPNADRNVIRLAEFHEIWARKIFPSLVQQQPLLAAISHAVEKQLATW